MVVLPLGMLAGIMKGIRQEFRIGPADADLNLAGGLLMFLFGLHNRLFPAIARSLLTHIPGWLRIVGGRLFAGGMP